MLKPILKKSDKDDVHYCVSRERDENFERMEERHYNNSMLTDRFRAAQLMDYCEREQCERGSWEPRETKVRFDGWVPVFMFTPYFDGYCMECLSGDEAIENG